MAKQKKVTNKNATRLVKKTNITDKRLQRLKGDLEDLDRLLEKVLDIIQVPRDVSEKFSELDDTMERVLTLLDAVVIVPPITENVKKFQSALVRLRNQKVHPVREKVNGIEEDIAPYRKYTADIRSFFREMVPLIGNLDRFIRDEHNHVKQTDNSNTKLKDGRYKRTQMEKLEKFSTGINKDLAEPMRTIVKMIRDDRAVGSFLDTIDEACRTLSDLLKPELSLLENMTALEKQLKKLDKSLDKNVNLVYYTISIRDLYNAFIEGKAIPFADKLAVQAEEVLRRQLDRLDLDIRLSTPGINKIEGEMRRVLENCNSIEDTMKGTQPKMDDMFKQKSLENTINSHDAK